MLHSQDITNYFKERVNFIIELQPDVSNEAKSKVLNDLRENTSVLESSIEFIPKMEALEYMSEWIGQTIEDNDNPFNDVILFNLDSEYFNEAFIQKLEKSFIYKEGMLQFYNPSANFDKISANLSKVQTVLFCIALFFILLGAMILRNTIRSIIERDRMLIKNMQFVGAQNSFIKRPFLRRTQWVFYKAFILMIFIMCLAFLFLFILAKDSLGFIRWEWVGLSVVLCFILGMLLTRWSSHAYLNRYLSKKLDELY